MPTRQVKANFPMRPSYVGEFHQGRFFHSRLENFLKQVNSTAENTSAYLFEQSLGQVVFLGVGAGLHLQELFNLRLIKHAVLVEHNPDNFLASLYLTDWQALLIPFIDSDDRSFTFSVGDSTALSEDKRLHEAFANAWNAMCMNVPFMPLETMYYVHKGDAFYTKVANRCNDEIEPYINVWGYYDDEVNQLNHVLHNINQKIPYLNE